MARSTAGRALVIGLAGVSGSGKTTLARTLAASLEGAVALHFDEYPAGWPSDLPRWAETGADLARIDVGVFAGRVDELRPRTRVLVLDFPWGRSHPAFSKRIDFALELALPPEQALARRLERYYELSEVQPDAWPDARVCHAIRKDLEAYESGDDRLVQEITRAAAAEGCDERIDAKGTREDVFAQAWRALQGLRARLHVAMEKAEAA